MFGLGDNWPDINDNLVSHLDKAVYAVKNNSSELERLLSIRAVYKGFHKSGLWRRANRQSSFTLGVQEERAFHVMT